MKGKIVALALALLVMTTVFAGGALGSPVSHTDGESVILTEGDQTEFVFDGANSSNSHEIRIIDSNGNQLAAYTATIEDLDGDGSTDDAYANAVDSDLINHSNYPVAEGDQIKVQLYDTTNSAVVESFNINVAHIADRSVTIDDATVQNSDTVSVEDREPSLAIWKSTKTVATLEEEVVFSDSQMNEEQRKAVIQVTDSEMQSAFSNSVSSLSSEDVAQQKVFVNGEAHKVYVDSAPSSDDTTVVYDTSQDALVITTTEDRQSLFVEATGNEYFTFTERFENFGFTEAFSGMFADFGDDDTESTA